MTTVNSKNQPSLLTLLLYQRLAGTITCPSEWTTVANWLDLPNYFVRRNPSTFLIEGLANAIISHSPITSVASIQKAWEFARDVSYYINEPQQQNLLSYLRSRAIQQEGDM